MYGYMGAHVTHCHLQTNEVDLVGLSMQGPCIWGILGMGILFRVPVSGLPDKTRGEPLREWTGRTMRVDTHRMCNRCWGALGLNGGSCGLGIRRGGGKRRGNVECWASTKSTQNVPVEASKAFHTPGGGRGACAPRQGEEDPET